MRTFSSYGPVDLAQHYAVARTELVERCVGQLVQGGHFFTVWGSRQTGKTWIMRRAMEEIRARHGDRFLVGALSMQDVVLRDEDPPEALLSWIDNLFAWGMELRVPPIQSWEQLGSLFRKGEGPFDRPLILFIDEFDKLPSAHIDRLISIFRGLYLGRQTSMLHGLALIGVRAVLGVNSEQGSPFNTQRSLQIPNLTREEVDELFRQYQTERGQAVEPEVVQKLYEAVRGQPGLTSWFGELLTEKYNRAAPRPIGLKDWDYVYLRACRAEPNNTVLNLLKKARAQRFRNEMVELFKTSNVPFSFDEDWCSYLYLNGIIDQEEVMTPQGEASLVCRFASPFIQHRLYNAFSRDMAALSKKVPPVDPRDDLTAIFATLDLPALLGRYRDFLRRLKQRGHNPWHGHPSRRDLHLREAVGHFHLYWWLMEASGPAARITPEFPTGNGKVDLHIQSGDHLGVIEVKSFTQRRDLPVQREQAARYAHGRGLSEATLALFVPSDDEELIAELSTEHRVPLPGQDVRVVTIAIAAV